jgi:V8-like Glu-specific endopeptidase
MKKKSMMVWFTVLSMLFVAFASQGVFAEELVGETAPINLSTAHPYAARSVREMVGSFEVSRQDATFIIVHFANFSLNDGDYVEIRDANGILRQVITNDDPGKTDFWAFAVDGHTAFVNLISGSVGAQAHGFDIDQYGYGYFPLGIESICGTDDKVDIECVSGTTQYERAKSAGRMLYQKGTSWYLCTGSLVSQENHFLSNEHCVNSQAIVNTLQVRFNYQYTTCGGSTLASYVTHYGDAFLVADYGYDCSLMTLSGDPQATFGHLELDPRDMILNETVYIPQHPGGVPKQYDYGPVVDTVANGRIVNSDFGYRVDTEGGSSGSPVLSMSDHKVVGLHHFGGCENPPSFQNQGVLMKNVYPIIEPYLPGGYAYCFEPSSHSAIYEFNKEDMWLIGDTSGGSCGEDNPIIGWVYENNWVLARDIPSAEPCGESVFYWGNLGPTKNYDWISSAGSTGTGTLNPCSATESDTTGGDVLTGNKDALEGTYCLVDNYGNQYDLTTSGMYIEGTVNHTRCGIVPLLGMVKADLFSFYVDIPSGTSGCAEGIILAGFVSTLEGVWRTTAGATGRFSLSPCTSSDAPSTSSVDPLKTQ